MIPFMLQKYTYDTRNLLIIRLYSLFLTTDQSFVYGQGLLQVYFKDRIKFLPYIIVENAWIRSV